jgi:hypothetical protein
MGLKCSVLGHKYGEASVERDREEQGSEVVITIREQETCERCGKTRIVSENKEVTSVETPSDIAGDVVEAQAATNDEESDASDAGTEPATGQADDAVTPVFESENDSADVGPVDPETDDAEIMSGSDDDVSSGDAELDEPTTDVAVPGAEEDVVAETEPEEDDGVIIDSDDETPVEDERAPGEWPEEPGDDGDDWKPETVLGDDADEASEQPEVEPVAESAVTVPDGEFFCEECGFSTPVESSSLRAGDFCPECHKGSLVQNADE